MIFLLIIQLTAVLAELDLQRFGNTLVLKNDGQYAYINLDTCPILNYRKPENNGTWYNWKQFCQSVQTQNMSEPTALDVRQLSSESLKLMDDPRYTAYYAKTNFFQLSDNGTNACHCKREVIDTELSTQGLTAVIVVPIVFFIGGLIMAKLNAHNSRSAWIHEFEQAQLKA